MPSTIAQSHNCKVGPSTRRRSISLGKKRKHRHLSDVFDNNDIEDTEDKGRKTTKKSQKLNSSGESHTRESSKRSRSASSVKTHRQQLLSNVSDGKHPQDKNVERKPKVAKVETKGYQSQSSLEPCRGILRTAVKPESSQRTVEAYKHRTLPDLFGGDLEKHAAQDAKVLDVLTDYGLPENVMAIVSPLVYFLQLASVVALVAQTEDPDVPLRMQPINIAAAIRDEDFRNVADSCYRSKSFMGIRNHPMLRKSKKLISKRPVEKLEFLFLSHQFSQ